METFVVTLTDSITTSVVGLYEDQEEAINAANDHYDKVYNPQAVPLLTFSFNEENDDNKMWAVVPFSRSRDTYFIEAV